jgi:alkaline phosphatase D
VNLNRYPLLSALFLALLIPCGASATAEEPLQRIAFGSCSHQGKPQPIWKAINAERPQLFMMLGDNVYGDTEDMALLAEKYRLLGDIEGFQQLRAQTPVIAIWDDHDYGENDAGREYPQKQVSRKLMLDFFGEPEDSPRRERADGIYTSYMYGPQGKRVHVILPDLRWNRDEILSVNPVTYQLQKSPKNLGPYLPHTNTDKTMLGEAQWQWLEAELQRPAEIKIIASSLQLLPEFTGWESWANFPHERERLFQLIDRHKVNGVMVVSGDTHWGELSQVEDAVAYPLLELTSSGLTETWKKVSPNKHRVGQAYNNANYGLIDIDWAQPDPEVAINLKDTAGKVILSRKLKLSDLSAYY